MSALLLDFLKSQELRGVKLGDPRMRVRESFGAPGWWEGKPRIFAEDSGVWRFGIVQINFGTTGKVEGILVHPDAQFPSGTGPVHSELVMCLEPIAVIANFVQMLQDNGIEFDLKENGKSKSLNVNGIEVKFRQLTNYEKSMEAGEQVVSSDFHLVSIVRFAYDSATHS